MTTRISKGSSVMRLSKFTGFITLQKEQSGSYRISSHNIVYFPESNQSFDDCVKKEAIQATVGNVDKNLLVLMTGDIFIDNAGSMYARTTHMHVSEYDLRYWTH